MNAFLNYLLEASIGLCLFLLVYQLFLRKETSFRLNRMFLLIAMIASVTFPLLKLNTADSPVPSLNLSVESMAAEELAYAGDDVVLTGSKSSLSTWQIISIIYAAGLLVFLVVFIIRLSGMLKALKQSPAYSYKDHYIVELKNQDSPFSFFNYIFIGNTPPLSEKETQQIIEHESIHAKLYHSFDILLLNTLGIIFWFNPVIRMYKKILVQLHEFEADARAVSTQDVDAYCNLLARVALHSVDYKLANHFSNSLTVKRIEMMRTLKHKIKSWKIAAVAAFLPILFFVVSCQDQVESPVVSESGAYPAQVQQAIDRLKASNPEVDFIVVPPSGPNPKDFEGKHATHLSYIDGQAVIESEAALSIETGKDENGNAIRYMIFTYNTRKKALPTKDQGKTAGEVYEETLGRNNKSQIDGEPIFLAVEQMPEIPGGIDAFRSRINKKLQYPAQSKRIGIEGKVFIKFVVKKDGTLTNFEILKGINQELDLEALRLLKTEAQGWKPGSQNGKPVHTQFVMPISFELSK
jgi:TonB family protein